MNKSSPHLTLLNKKKIIHHLSEKKQQTRFNVHLFDSIDSTNRYLKDLPVTNSVDICCAEMQTHGRGRFERHWHSPYGENIYCSSRWNLNANLNKLSGLSLVTSLAILATLKQSVLCSGIKIKWPNDILWGHKKLSGTLVEIIADNTNTFHVIIGIGLNVNTDTENRPLPDKDWCSLYEMSNSYYDRNVIIARLITNLDHYLLKFIRNGFDCFIDEWNQHDYLFGKMIHVTQSLNHMSGISRGVNQEGQLILEDILGVQHLLSSGDTSLQQV